MVVVATIDASFEEVMVVAGSSKKDVELSSSDEVAVTERRVSVLEALRDEANNKHKKSARKRRAIFSKTSFVYTVYVYFKYFLSL